MTESTATVIPAIAEHDFDSKADRTHNADPVQDRAKFRETIGYVGVPLTEILPKESGSQTGFFRDDGPRQFNERLAYRHGTEHLDLHQMTEAGKRERIAAEREAEAERRAEAALAEARANIAKWDNEAERRVAAHAEFERQVAAYTTDQDREDQRRLEQQQQSEKDFDQFFASPDAYIARKVEERVHSELAQRLQHGAVAFAQEFGEGAVHMLDALVDHAVNTNHPALPVLREWMQRAPNPVAAAAAWCEQTGLISEAARYLNDGKTPLTNIVRDGAMPSDLVGAGRGRGGGPTPLKSILKG
jgi:hypothetical protein